MNKKPAKVDEPATTYGAKKRATPADVPAPAGIRFADLPEVRKTNAKLMQVHRKVLQKLAQ